jgi:hypothetical protein
MPRGPIGSGVTMPMQVFDAVVAQPSKATEPLAKAVLMREKVALGQPLSFDRKDQYTLVRAQHLRIVQLNREENLLVLGARRLGWFSRKMRADGSWCNCSDFETAASNGGRPINKQRTGLHIDAWSKSPFQCACRWSLLGRAGVKRDGVGGLVRHRCPRGIFTVDLRQPQRRARVGGSWLVKATFFLVRAAYAATLPGADVDCSCDA